MSPKKRKTNVEYISLAEQRGLIWLGKDAPRTKDKTPWQCKQCSLVWRAAYSTIRAGHGCPRCARVFPKGERDYADLAREKGLFWLGNIPKNIKEKTLWQCESCGHIWESSYNGIRSHKGCPECVRENCAEKKRLGPEAYRELALRSGLVWIGPSVLNINEPTEWLCRNGHKLTLSFHRITTTLSQGGRPCKQCGTQRYIETYRKKDGDFHALANQKNLIWVGPMPIGGTKGKTYWQCRCGSVWQTSYAVIRQGVGLCPSCVHKRAAEQNQPKSEEYQALGRKKNFTWMPQEMPATARTDTLWRCNACGSQFYSSYRRVTNMKSCPVCCPNRRKTSQDYHDLAAKKQLIWSGNHLPGKVTQLTKWICTRCKVEFENSFTAIKENRGCPHCHQMINGAPVSKVQETVCAMIEDILHCGCTLNERLLGVSVDITARFLGRTIAIFYDSYWWHGEPDNQQRDQRLSQKLADAGMLVLRIRSDAQLPSTYSLEMTFDRLLRGESVIVLDLEDWGTRPSRYEKFSNQDGKSYSWV